MSYTDIGPAAGTDRTVTTARTTTKRTAQDRPACNGEPPSTLTNPLVRRQKVDRATWSRAIRGRVPIEHVAVIRTLADYGDKDGTECRPGNARLAADLLCSERTVLRSMTWSEEHGFTSLQRRGSRKLRQANVYMLTLPAPVAVELGLWPTAEALWGERPASMDRTRFLGDRAVSKKPFLGDSDEFLGDSGGVLCDSGGTPPGPRTPGPIDHHSDADASGSPRGERDDPWASFKANDHGCIDNRDDALNRLAESHDLDAAEYSVAMGMLDKGVNPAAVSNKILADRRDQEVPA